MQGGNIGETAGKTHLWILRIDPDDTPLDQIRAGVVERILELRAANAAEPD
jgi:hypothetical protein